MADDSGSITGFAKEKLGSFTGNDDLRDEGLEEQGKDAVDPWPEATGTQASTDEPVEAPPATELGAFSDSTVPSTEGGPGDLKDNAAEDWQPQNSPPPAPDSHEDQGAGGGSN